MAEVAKLFVRDALYHFSFADYPDSFESINQSIVKFITRYFQVLSVNPVMNRKRGWDSGVSPSAGGRGASLGAN